MMGYLLFVAAGFASGAVMYSYLLPKAVRGIDIVEESDDGNAGAFNAFHLAGAKLGMACVALDVVKGFVPVFAAWHVLDAQNITFALVVAAPVMGHIVSSATSIALMVRGVLAAPFGLAGIAVACCVGVRAVKTMPASQHRYLLFRRYALPIRRA